MLWFFILVYVKLFSPEGGSVVISDDIYLNPLVLEKPSAKKKVPLVIPLKFKRVLGLGSKGNDVKDLQLLLKKQGFYRGVINTSFTAATRKALQQFQKVVGLPVTGILDQKTKVIVNKME